MDIDDRPGEQTATGEQGPSGEPSASGDRTASEPRNAPEEAAPSSALAALSRDGTVTLGVSEIRSLATELATQLFQKWELALQEQFRAELGIRLEAELEHREHEARQLRAEVRERRQRIDNPWPTRNKAWGHATWELENTVRRQAAELAQTEREMRMLRERLRELGHPSDGAPVTVDAEPDVAEPGDPPG
jgi:hypothetical protein